MFADCCSLSYCSLLFGQRFQVVSGEPEQRGCSVDRGCSLAGAEGEAEP